MTAAESFNVLFAAVPRSPTLRHIWHVGYGPDYSEEADPFSFVTLTDLRRIAREVGVGPGQILVDLACGRGGPGLWIAVAAAASATPAATRLSFVHAPRERLMLCVQARRCVPRLSSRARSGAPTNMPISSVSTSSSGAHPAWACLDHAGRRT